MRLSAIWVLALALLGAETSPHDCAYAKDPSPEEASEALRQQLVTAYFTAPKIHRAYAFARGERRLEVEVFRSGDRHGLVWRAQGAAFSWAASDGRRLAFSTEAAPAVANRRTATSIQDQWEPFGSAIHSVCALWGATDPSPPAFRAAFAVEIDPSDDDEEKMQFSMNLVWEEGLAPNWLSPEAFAAQPGSGSEEAVPTTVWGLPARLHRSDGSVAEISSGPSKTGQPWTLRETKPTMLEQAWVAKIDGLCKESAGAPGAAGTMAEFAPTLLAAAVGRLLRIITPARSNWSFWLSALRIVSVCAWQTPENSMLLKDWVRRASEAMRMFAKKKLSQAQVADGQREAAKAVVGRLWPQAQRALAGVYRGEGVSNRWADEIDRCLKYYLGQWVAEEVAIAWEESPSGH